VIARRGHQWRLGLRRIGAMMLRHFYLMRRSWPRLLDLIYWPALNVVLWGFITIFLTGHSSWLAQTGGLLVTAVLLWDILFRGQIGLFLTFLEEVWSRNLGHLMVTPMRPIELVASLLLASLLRTLFAVGTASALAIPLFGISVYDLGLPLAGYFFNLIAFGWSMGLIVSGLVLRYGQSAEHLGWVLVFMIVPICGVYYPLEVLPPVVHWIALAVPPSHVFEGMRAILIDHQFRLDLMINATILNMLYLAAAIAGFLGIVRQARVHGQLLQLGE